MVSTRFLWRFFWFVLLTLNTVMAFALSTPKFSIIPIVRPTGVLSANSVVQAQYLIVNNTVFPRTLTMSPITGVSQVMGAPGTCSSPFLLEHGQSCLLVVQIAGSITAGRVHSPLVVCKTMGIGDNRPDPFLCSQTAPGAEFDLSFTGPLLPTNINVTPNPLVFSAVVGGAVTVTNTATNASANNIVSSAPADPNFTQRSQCPAVLLPQQSCQIFYNSAVTATTSSRIQGINTNPILLGLESVRPVISLSSTSLSFIVQNGAAVTVTNTSTTAYAQNVGATITSGPFFVQSNTCGSLLAPGATCTITLNTNTNAHVTGTAVIQGTNTDPQPPQTVSLSASPANITALPTLQFPVNGSGILAVGNVSAGGSAFNVRAQIPASAAGSLFATACSSISSGGTCNITFTSAVPQTVDVVIAGTNTNSVPVTVTVTISTITVTPSLLSFVDANTGNVTVQNTSTFDANNVAARPPSGSIFLVNSSSCPSILPPTASCVISFTTPINFSSTSQSTVPIYGDNTNQIGVNIQAKPASISIFTLNPSEDVGNIAIRNDSSGTAYNIVPTLSGGLTETFNDCNSVLSGAFCTITLSGSLDYYTTIPIQGSNTTQVIQQLAPVGISASPTNLTIQTGQSGTVTVSKNHFGDRFEGIAIKIPPGSTLTISNNNCVNGIGIGSSTCSFQLTGGPLLETQIVTVQGTDSDGNLITNPVGITVNVIEANVAKLSVTSNYLSPTTGVINLDDASLSTTFVIQNSPSSTITATNITAALPPAWTSVQQIPAGGCPSLAPGASCTLTFSSPIPYIAQGGIEVAGDNTTSINIALAFIKGGGLVYAITNTETKVANSTDNNPSTGTAWGSYLLTNATNQSDGSVNQPLILAADPTAPAALLCLNDNDNGNTDWYLPAIDELEDIYNNLFLIGFGSYAQGTSPSTVSYWSSTENNVATAWIQNFTVSPGLVSADYKNITYRVICVRKA